MVYNELVMNRNHLVTLKAVLPKKTVNFGQFRAIFCLNLSFFNIEISSQMFLSLMVKY